MVRLMVVTDIRLYREGLMRLLDSVDRLEALPRGARHQAAVDPSRNTNVAALAPSLTFWDSSLVALPND